MSKKAAPTADKAESNQNLTRGLAVIECLSDFPNGCPLAKISELTGINKSTAHRLLQSLADLGYVTPAPSPGSYRLTGKFIAIGYKTYSALNIIHVAAPHLEQLNLDTGETVNLGAREGNGAIIVYKLEPTVGALRTRGYLGQRILLYCSGIGKVFLAFSPEGYLDKYWEAESGSIQRLTSNTIISKNVMRHELARIREEKIAYDREENELGICCIAAPIFGIHNRVDYSVSVAMPLARADDKVKMRVAKRLDRAAQTISKEIGGLL